MTFARRTLLLSLALTALSSGAAQARLIADVRDKAQLFSPEAVRKAVHDLQIVERRTGIPILIETVPTLRVAATADELEGWKSLDDETRVNRLAVRRDREEGNSGIYLLIAKEEHVLSNVLVPERVAARLPKIRRNQVRDELIRPFHEGRYDEGLSRAVQAFDEFLPNKDGSARHMRVAPAKGRRSMFTTLIILGIVIFGGLMILRLIGAVLRALFGFGGRPGYGRPGYGRPGYGPGYGGGYGPGYGGGGGFMSSIFGGLGGALFGNWAYDQMTGRHQQHGNVPTDYGSTSFPGDSPGYGGGEIVGGDDNSGRGASWGDTGGDWGGGGGDAGGDWGGGGGDWGGGNDEGAGGNW